MVKGFIIGALVGIVLVLLILAGLNPPADMLDAETVGPKEIVEEPVFIEQPEEQAPVQDQPVKEDVPLIPPETTKPKNIAPAGESFVPDKVAFWVNQIQVPPYSESFYDFIPLKETKLKTFSGTFGPYAIDPRQDLRVDLCSELYKVPSAPACQPVQLSFQDAYASFAVGLAYDEFIGGMAAKDYLAYYKIFYDGNHIATSNKAVVRTVKD